MSTFDKITWKYRQMGGYYVKCLKEFRLPRSYDPGQLAKYFRGYTIRVDNDAYPADKVDYDLTVPPRDDFQRVGLTFLCSQEEFRKNAQYTTLLIDAKTGAGKTYLGSSAPAFLHARVVVFVPISKLLNQWRDSFLNFTSLKEKEVMVVRGSKTCEEIRNGEHEKVKVFIFSNDTVVSYQKRYGDMNTINMLASTNAYVKIVDEVHLDLKAVSMIDALSNFRMNFYMSATPGRSPDKENWIFRNCFRNLPWFGGNFEVEEEKHINIFIRPYRFVPTAQQISRMVQARTGWLNSNSYERELINASEDQVLDFCNMLRAVLRWSKSLLKEGNKILILTETVDGTGFVSGIAESIFPEEVSAYYGGMTADAKAEALKSTVICATSRSLGTGADIPHIQHVYNIVTYSNWISAKQLPGRARALKDGTEVAYIEFVNFSYRKTAKQFEKRKPTLLKIAKGGKIGMFT